ncbi:MAG: hypothetical protein CENE_01736 [Candidatus Celerinatantimonas neptuna]|nr:MAG: hypothetical protein CENE_01736 [Candidatus Celerinatantimonas neptuna]
MVCMMVDCINPILEMLKTILGICSATLIIQSAKGDFQPIFLGVLIALYTSYFMIAYWAYNELHDLTSFDK